MLKRLLPLLFVVFVTLATVFLFLAFREPPDGPTVTPQAPDARGSGGPGPLAGQGVPAPDGVTEYRVASEEDYLLALEALGTSPEEIEAWARSRGFPPATFTAAAGIPLDQPYRRYDGDTLRGLAESGDVWAMQFLAADLARARPLEAALWYRAAALRGSVFAARELAGLYHDIDRALATGRTEHWETGIRQGVDALAEAEDPLAATALAWLLAAETEGSLPAGSLALTQAGFHDPTPLIAEACARAGAILAELASRREAAGIEAPPRRPPPFSVELPPEETAGYCAAGTLRRPDYTGCETVRLVSDTGAVTAHRCPGAD